MGRPRKASWDYVVEDAKSFGLSGENVQVQSKSSSSTSFLACMTQAC